MYQDYYSGKNQFVGGNMPIFVGAKYQRGHGLGNVLGGLFRSIILPFIKRNAPMMVNKAMKTGINMAGDVASGVPFKQSIKRQLPKTLKEAVDEVKFQLGSGAPKSKHRRITRPRSRPRSRPRGGKQRRHRRGGRRSGDDGKRGRRRYNDIFA